MNNELLEPEPRPWARLGIGSLSTALGTSHRPAARHPRRPANRAVPRHIGAWDPCSSIAGA